jgi:outer membrane receptor protein involved in Fe transport
VGAFYKHDNLDIGNTAETTPALPVSVFDLNVAQHTDQYAVFGEGDLRLTDKLHFVAGVRYFEENITYDSTIAGLLPLVLSGVGVDNLPSHTTADRVTPKFSLYYKADSNVLLYATASAGFREGGINPEAFLFPGAPTSFGPESLWNYEGGAKTSWFDHRLTLNAAVYAIRWNNVIVNAVTGNPLFAYSVNAGKAHSNGAELEMVATPTKGLELTLSGNYTDAAIDSTEQVAPLLEAQAGAKLPYTPQYKVYGAVQYTFPLSSEIDGRVRLDAAHTAKTYSAIDDSPAGINAAYDTVNLRASLISGRWELIAFADNLNNARGELQYGGLDIVGHNESVLVRPRTIGLTLRAHY